MLYRLNRWTSSETAWCYIINITGSIWRWRGAKLAGCTATVHDDLAQDAGGYSNPANIAHGMLLGVDYLRSSCENSGHIFRTGEVFLVICSGLVKFGRKVGAKDEGECKCYRRNIWKW